VIVFVLLWPSAPASAAQIGLRPDNGLQPRSKGLQLYAQEAAKYVTDPANVTLLALELQQKDADAALDLARKDAVLDLARKDAALELALARKDAALDLAKKDAELALAKQAAAHRSQLLRAKNAELGKQQQEALRQIAGQAVVVNRCLFELCLNCYGKGGATTSDQHKHFVQHKLVTKSGRQLSARALHTLQLLQRLKPTTAQAKQVVRELEAFMHILSRGMHVVNVDRAVQVPGVYVGGPEPLCSAMAVFVVEMQKDKLLDLPVVLLNEAYEPECLLVGGNATVLPA